MITQAIYDLLSNIGVTVYAVIAPQEASYPFIIINEDGEPENSKDGYDVEYYDLQIDVYCEKGKTISGGVFQSTSIADDIKDVLDRYSGTSGGKEIDTIIYQNGMNFYDNVSQATRHLSEYRVRTRPSTIIEAAVYWVDNTGGNIITDTGDNLIFN